MGEVTVTAKVGFDLKLEAAVSLGYANCAFARLTLPIIFPGVMWGV